MGTTPLFNRIGRIPGCVRLAPVDDPDVATYQLPDGARLQFVALEWDAADDAADDVPQAWDAGILIDRGVDTVVAREFYELDADAAERLARSAAAHAVRASRSILSDQPWDMFRV